MDRPTPPQPIDRDGLAGLQAAGAQGGADPGQHATADQRRAVERQVRIDPDQ